VVVLRTENLDKTIVVLQENGITLLTWENVLAL